MSWDNFDTFLLRGFMPLILLGASVTRYSAFSFIYLLMLLICPLIRYDIQRKRKPIEIFLIIMLVVSGIFTISIPIYQIPVTFQPKLLNCSNTVTLVMHQIGMLNLMSVKSNYRMIRILLPDYVVLLMSIVLLIYFCRRTFNPRQLQSPISNFTNNQQALISSSDEHTITQHQMDASIMGYLSSSNADMQHQQQQQQQQQQSSSNVNNKAINRKQGVTTVSPLVGEIPPSQSNLSQQQQQQHQQQQVVHNHNYLQETFGIHRLKKKIWRAWAMQSLFVFFNVVVTGIGGIMSPSILNSVYLFSFLGVCTYWACGNKVITTNFAYMRIFLLMYSAIHVCLLYLVQIEFMQFYLPDGDFSSRLLGLYYLFNTSCSLYAEIQINDHRFIDYLSPCVIVFIYYLYATETRRWFEKGRESVPRVRSLKEESRVGSTLKPTPIKDPELQHLIPDREGSSSQATTTTGSGNNNNTTFNRSNMLGGYGNTKNNPNYQTLITTTPPLINQMPTTSDMVTQATNNQFQQQQQEYLFTTSMPMVDFNGKYSPQHQHHLLSSISGDHNLLESTIKHPPAHNERPLLLSLINTAIRNSYVFTFINMMAWSVTYKSWMTFILLLSACVLWMMPDSRQACLYMSPLIVFYATTLIIIQYIYGFNLKELPQYINTSNGQIDLNEIGLQKSDIPTKPLAMMIGFIVFFWLTLRLFMNERISKNQRERSDQSFRDSPMDQDSNADSEAYFGDVDNMIYRKTISFLNAICQKYWILVCCLAMLVVSIQAPVVVFRIIYMGMLIYFQLTFMISYSFWRKQMYVFWWVVIVYSVIVLLGIYTFQFKQFPNLWQNKTGLSKDILHDIGLQTYENAALFRGLLTPVVFLVVIIVQVRYFHKPFLRLSCMSRFQFSGVQDLGENQTNLNASTASTSTSNISAFIEDVNSAFQAIVEKLKIFFDNIYTKVWRFLEVHFTKIVVFLIMYACINEVNALNMVLIFILVIGVPFPKLHPFVVTFSFFWCSVFVLLKMIYQLNTVKPNTWTSNCSNNNNPTVNSSHLINNANWIGLMKVSDFQYHISIWTTVLISCAMWHAVKYHQRQFFNAPDAVKPSRGVVFSEITAQTLDDSLLNLFKFFINYTFYKLGLELCFIITVIVATLRVDVYSVVYLVLLLVFLCTPRKICAKIWWFYLLLLGILMPIQYACCVGFPSGLCLVYPFNISLPLQQWLFLPNYNKPPVAKKIMADFMQFIFVALQYQVFEIEKSTDVVKYGGGKNRPIISNELPKTFDKDFVSTKDSYVDYLKHAVFYWSYWVSLAVVFITGVFWITLFCLGYMILAFIYLWMGQNIMLRKRSNLIASWNVIIYYNFFVILAKCSLQLMGCVYMKDMINWSLCWIIQLFGVQCINPMSWNFIPTNNIDINPGCSTVDSGLHWDVACFLCIILQRKIFMTKSFCHVVLDLNVQNRFASRGAHLINRKMMATIREQKDKEDFVLVKIQQKIDKIVQRQAQHGKPELNEHYLVMRSGDYYLFEGDPEEDDEEVDNLKIEPNPMLSKRGMTCLTDEDAFTDLLQQQRTMSSFDSPTILPNSLAYNNTKNLDNASASSPVNANAANSTNLSSNSNKPVSDDKPISPILPPKQLNTIRESLSSNVLDQDAATNSSNRKRSSVNTEATTPGSRNQSQGHINPGNLSEVVNQEYQSSQIGDSSSSDDDDANPNKATGSHINPLQLINKAMEQGPRSAIREFKRTQSECRGEGAYINSNRRSSVHLGSRLESMSEQDELSSLPEAYTTPPGSTVPMLHTKSESTTTEDDSFHSAAGGNQQQHNDGLMNKLVVLSRESSTQEKSRADVEEDDDDDDDDDKITCINDNPPNYDETMGLIDKCTPEDIKSSCSKSTHAGSCWSKFKASIIIFYYFIQSTTDSIIILLNGWTREYRRISRTLDNEKRLVKRKVISKINNEINAQIELESIVMEIVGDKNANIASTKNQEEDRKEQEFRRSRNRFFLLITALANVAVVYSEFVCYFLLILNHMLSGNIFSLPYPLMVFLWAMLSVPRPSKNFWIALITYTEIIIVIKYIFQFKFIEFNSIDTVQRMEPLRIHLIIGIEKADNYATLDLIQLLFIFLHRGYLKNNGLWRDHTEFAQDLEKVDAEQNARDRTRPSYEEIYQNTGRSCNPFYKIKRFYAKMTNPKFNKKVDVYVYMFLCEFIAFLIIIFGYVAFGPGTDSADNAFDFIKTNKMPVPFVIMLITQFIFFIIDRALFLRKKVIGKFAFQIFHVLLIHAWLFFALPHITKKKFNSQIAPQLLYFVKCIYFALSAYQMKSGYPLRILGNFLTRDFNYLNLILFKGYMLVPFLYELRNVMDWMWTDTAVALYHWMEVEDVFCKIFVLKCWRRSELEYPTPRGHTRRLATKYTVGFLLLSFFFISFWGPLTLSSFISTTFIKNPPMQCNIDLDIGGYTPIFTFNSRGNNLKELSKESYDSLKNCYSNIPTSTDYIQSFEVSDITEIHMDGASSKFWDINPNSFQLLKNKLNFTELPLNLNMEVFCERRDVDAKSIEKVVSYTSTRELSKKERQNLLLILDESNNNTNKPTVIYFDKIFPRYLTAYKRTLNKGDALVFGRNDIVNYTYLNVRATFHKQMIKSPTRVSSPTFMWWTLDEIQHGNVFCSNKSEEAKLHDNLLIVVFSERVSDNLFGHLFSNYGILGMYAAYIFVAHRVLRAFYSDISYIIRCEELPHVDRILNLLNEIYLVRENKMFRLEEQLIAKLIFLYRSSETMIKWTRHKRSILEKHMESTIQQINNSQPPAVGGGRGSVDRTITMDNEGSDGPESVVTNRANITTHGIVLAVS